MHALVVSDSFYLPFVIVPNTTGVTHIKDNFLVILQKAVQLQAWCGPEGSRKFGFPDFMTTAQVVSVTHQPHLPQGILLVLISVRG
jgi:hypothetical protein